MSVPIELISQGDENALGFSLEFDTAVLTYVDSARGADASSAQLNVNDENKDLGKLGIALALPAGQTFAAGIREIVIVKFDVNPETTDDSTDILFTDDPIAREIVDADANTLTATWTSGTVSITHGYEADVAPRPNGNGSVTISDWVQVGRFVAKLDTPRTDVNEFQRADNAPKPCGDGKTTIANWVQAGRYAAGLDTLHKACGPTEPNPFSTLTAKAAFAPFNTAKALAQESVVRVVGDTISAGDTGAVKIELEAVGNENALGFSLVFDPAILKYESASLGPAAGGAFLNVNTNEVQDGRVGLALALSAGQSFSAGTQEIVNILFVDLSKIDTVLTTLIHFGDQPIAREVVDANAIPVSATFVDGKAVITSVEDSRVSGNLPNRYDLQQNYPNPFNPETTIRYLLPTAGQVEITIYNTLGETVRTLVSGQKPAGEHQAKWDGRNDAGRHVASGLYVYSLRVGQFIQTRKMLLMR